MSKFDEALNVIPPAAKITAACVYVGFAAIAFLASAGDPEIAGFPAWGRGLFCLGIPLIPLVLTLLIGYVNGDARRRGMRYVMWTLLAIFIPNGIGIILYFILREPLLRNCPSCGAGVKGGFAFCPKCGASLAQACPQCRGAVESDWTHCARCGAGLRAA